MAKFLQRFFQRTIKFFFQRIFRGWDDSETWSLDVSLARAILPRLKHFKKLNKAYPVELTFDSWNAILDEMIYSFEFISSERYYQSSDHEERERAARGFELFCKHYRSLWW